MKTAHRGLRWIRACFGAADSGAESKVIYPLVFTNLPFICGKLGSQSTKEHLEWAKYFQGIVKYFLTKKKNALHN